MLCRNCRTEIADKALICYRCGTPTEEPKVTPPSAARRSPASSRVASVLALVLLVLLALYMGSIAKGEVPRLLGWAAVALAVVVIALRGIARRR
jgi:hypothetical protein